MQQSYDVHSHDEENKDQKQETSLSSCIIPANNQQQQRVDSYVVDHASSCVLPVS